MTNYTLVRVVLDEWPDAKLCLGHGPLPRQLQPKPPEFTGFGAEFLQEWNDTRAQIPRTTLDKWRDKQIRKFFRPKRSKQNKNKNLTTAQTLGSDD
jgi:hypothetical protein